MQTLNPTLPKLNPGLPKPDQWAVLAALRMGLAFIVLVCHAAHYVHFPAALYAVTFCSGFAAVLGFLIISGYSIGHSYAARPHGFYGRRVDRIYPLYLAAFVLALLLMALGYDRMTSPANLVGNAFLLQGVFTERIRALDPAWTLAIECLCYLLTPLFARLSTRSLLALIGASGLYYLLRFRWCDLPYWDMLWGQGLLCLLWAWLLGFLYHRTSELPWAKALLLLLPVVLLGFGPDGKEKIAALPIIAASAAILFGPTLPVRCAPVLCYLGDLSYPVYIFHYAVLLILCGMGVQPWLPFIAVPLLASVAVYHAVDLPYRRYARARSATRLHGQIRFSRSDGGPAGNPGGEREQEAASRPPVEAGQETQV